MKKIATIILMLISSISYSQNNKSIESLIENSSTLSQVMAGINFSFEQSGEKKKSNDGKYVTVTYTNSTPIRPMVTYMEDGTVTQIIFLMPIKQGEKIIKKLISQYGTKTIDGEDVIQKGSITYNFRNQEEIGMVILY